MGELLKTAGASQDGIANYHRFSEALTHFDGFLEKIIRTEINRRKNTEPFQSELFEKWKKT